MQVWKRPLQKVQEVSALKPTLLPPTSGRAGPPPLSGRHGNETDRNDASTLCSRRLIAMSWDCEGRPDPDPTALTRDCASHRGGGIAAAWQAGEQGRWAGSAWLASKPLPPSRTERDHLHLHPAHPPSPHACFVRICIQICRMCAVGREREAGHGGGYGPMPCPQRTALSPTRTSLSPW